MRSTVEPLIVVDSRDDKMTMQRGPRIRMMMGMPMEPLWNVTGATAKLRLRQVGGRVARVLASVANVVWGS